MDTRHLRGGRALVLGYHRIAVPSSDVWSLCVTPDRFAEQLQQICEIGRPQLLEDVVRHGPTLDPTIVVTFDDGYADTLLTAVPLLRQFGVPATVFLSTGYIGSDREFWWDALDRLLLTPGTLPPTLHATIGWRQYQWTFNSTVEYDAEACRRYRDWRAWEKGPTERHAAYRQLWELLGPLREDHRREVLDDLFAEAGVDSLARATHRLLREGEVVELASSPLIQLGSHTVTHSILSAQDPSEQRHEISGSKSWLEELSGQPVTTFAYPFGQREHYTEETAAITREVGFLCACANFPGLLTSRTNPYEIPRLQMHDYDGHEFGQVLNRWLA